MKLDYRVLYLVNILLNIFFVCSYRLKHRRMITSTVSFKLVLITSMAMSILKFDGFKFDTLLLAYSRTNLKGFVLYHLDWYLWLLWVYSTQAQQHSIF